MKTKINFKNLLGYFDVVTRPLVMIWPKGADMLKLLKVKMEIKIRIRMINSFVPQKLLEIYKIIWTTIEDSQEISLPVYDGRYIKTILREYA